MNSMKKTQNASNFAAVYSSEKILIWEVVEDQK